MAPSKKTLSNTKKISKQKDDEVGFAISNMDLQADPIKDFYSYANGTWLKKHKIPEDKVSFGSFNQLYEKNQMALKEILESCSKKTRRTPIEAMCGDFYKSFMAPGSYTIVVSSQFYTTVTEIVAINPDLTTTVYVNLSYSTLAPVVQYTPLNISSTEYSLAWSALYGTDRSTETLEGCLPSLWQYRGKYIHE